MAILSKTWWRNFVKGDPNETEEIEDSEEEALSADGGTDAEDDLSEEEDEESFDEEEQEDLPPPRSAWRAPVETAKDFFSTELIYRFDILAPQEQAELRGSYRVEVKGNKGGVWTLLVGEQLEVLNRREEAEVILSLQQRDFMQLVNGDLNPQMAILAQKIRLSGDVRRGVLFQNLLAPSNQD